MNPLLHDVIRDSSPKINPKIARGVAKEVVAQMPAYLDEFFRSGITSLSPRIDFNYLGYRRMTPKEEYTQLVASRDSTIAYDLSHNNVYVVEFRFEYCGQEIRRPIYLPYVEHGNIMVMGGTNYHVMPVLSDSVVSPSTTGVFVRLLKAKLNFTTRARYFIHNGVRKTGDIVNGEILKPKKIVDNIGRPLTPTALYLLGKFGIVDTLKIYGNVSDVIITSGNVDPAQYPGYEIYESTKIKPRGLKAVPYVPHNVKILVSGDNMDVAFVESVIFSVIYSLDILPFIEDDLVEVTSSKNLDMEIMFWRIVLGRIIYKNSYSVQRITQDLNDHFDTLNGYVDDLIKEKLKDAGIKVNNFFDLLAVMLSNFSHWVLTSKEYNSNIENRYIDTLYYITYDIIIGFNRAILALNKRITKTNNISHKEVSKILSNELGSKKVYSLTKSTEPNLAISVVDYSGDLIYPKVSSIIEDQNRGNGVKRGSKSTIPEAARTLKGGDLGFGSLLFLGKNLPSPRFKLNLYVDYNVTTGKIQYPEDIARALVKLNELLQGMEPNTLKQSAELECENIDVNKL